MTDQAVVDLLHAIQADLATVKADVAENTRMLRMLQQDTGMIRTTVTGHTIVLNILQQDTRMIRATIHDMGETRDRRAA
jgi:hypothetical protein